MKKLRLMGADCSRTYGWFMGFLKLAVLILVELLPPTLSYLMMAHVILVKAESCRALIAVYFTLQHWWENPISCFGGCEEYLPEHLHLQPRGRCLWCQRVLQRFPRALLYQHVAEGKKGTPKREPLFHLVHLLTCILAWNTQWFCKDCFVMWSIIWNSSNFFSSWT